MPGMRHPATSLVGVSALLAGLVACASTVEGQAEYAGAGATTTTTTQTATETTETTTETTETTAETTETTASGPSELETTACFLIPLSDLDAFEAFNTLADMPPENQTQDMRNNVASLFDEASIEVQTYIDPLPPGPIRDAAMRYKAAQVEVRDKLNAGTDVNTQIVLDAQDVLETVCGTG